MKTHLILANTRAQAQFIADERGLLFDRWVHVVGPESMLGRRDVVLHIERGYVETPRLIYRTLSLPGTERAWGTESHFPILDAVQMMIQSGAIREVRQYA